MADEIEKGRVGPSFEDFLKDEGVYEETTERALARMEDHETRLAALRAHVMKGVSDDEAGRVTELDGPEAIDAFFKTLRRDQP